MLREDDRSVYIEKGRLIRAPARSPLRVTEPDKSRVTYPDSTPFSRTGFFGTFPKQKRIRICSKTKLQKEVASAQGEEHHSTRTSCMRATGPARRGVRVFPLFSPPHMLQVTRRASSLLRRSPSPRISKVVLNSSYMPSHECHLMRWAFVIFQRINLRVG